MLQIRQHASLTIADLKKLRIAWSRARYFVITADANPYAGQIDSPALRELVADKPQQLMLF